MRLQAHIRSGGFIVLTIALYAAFFAAQIFSVNQDAPGSSHTVFIYGTKHTALKPAVYSNSGDCIKGEVKPSVRINKRFQIEDVSLTVPVMDFDNPSFPVSLTTPFVLHQKAIESPLIRVCSLRGPPAVALSLFV